DVYKRQAMANAYDDDEEDEKKWERYYTSLGQSVLKSRGLMGVAQSSALSLAMSNEEWWDSKKGQLKYGGEWDLAEAVLNTSPAVGTKFRRLRYTLKNPYYEQYQGENPMLFRAANGIQFATNLPSARINTLYGQAFDAFSSTDLEGLERLGRFFGLTRYDLQKGIKTKKKKKNTGKFIE
ncbi:MAG: hypothetical protein MPJ25_08950, partial [Pirellulales bacterium]|nr:hypothetical protein [Pirellulales bacterium]